VDLLALSAPLVPLEVLGLLAQPVQLARTETPELQDFLALLVETASMEPLARMDSMVDPDS